MKTCPKDAGSFEQYLTKQNVPASDKSQMIKAAARTYATDLRPFNIIAREGFKNFPSVIFKIALRLIRPCDFHDPLPDSNTIRNNVRHDAGIIRGKLVEICVQKANSNLYDAYIGNTTAVTSRRRRKSSPKQVAVAKVL